MSGTDDLDVSFRDDDFDLDEQKRSRAASQHSNNPPPTQTQTETQTQSPPQPTTSSTLLSNPRGSLSQPSLPPSHARRLSLLALKPKNSLGDLSALGLSNPADYLRLFRTVLNLQKKCRAWRIKIKQRLKEKVEAEKLRQEQELQQKIQQRKKRKESELHQHRLSISHLTPGKNTPQGSARGSASSTPATFKVVLPDRPEELLQFTLCMMRIQRKFRKKLQQARAVLVERLKKQKEAQEREMQEKIMKGKKRKESGTVTTHTTPKAQVNRLDLDRVTRTRAISAPPIQEEKQQMSTTQSLSTSVEVDGGDDALRGSLTNRLRKERKQRRDERLVKLLAEAQQQQQSASSSAAPQQRVTATDSNTEHNGAATVSASRSNAAAAVDREIQVTDDELNESLRVAQLDVASLFIPITSTLNAQRPTSSAHTHRLNSTTASNLSSSPPRLSTYDNSLPYIPDTRLRDQHLQIQALLASMPKQTKKPTATTTNATTTQSQTAESGPENKTASAASSSSAAQPIYLTCSLLCPPQYLTAPLYKRVFGPKRNRSHWAQAEEAIDLLIADDGDDWEELIHLPLFTSTSTTNTATSS